MNELMYKAYSSRFGRMIGTKERRGHWSDYVFVEYIKLLRAIIHQMFRACDRQRTERLGLYPYNKKEA